MLLFCFVLFFSIDLKWLVLAGNCFNRISSCCLTVWRLKGGKRKIWSCNLSRNGTSAGKVIKNGMEPSAENDISFSIESATRVEHQQRRQSGHGGVDPVDSVPESFCWICDRSSLRLFLLGIAPMFTSIWLRFAPRRTGTARCQPTKKNYLIGAGCVDSTLLSPIHCVYSRVSLSLPLLFFLPALNLFYSDDSIWCIWSAAAAVCLFARWLNPCVFYWCSFLKPTSLTGQLIQSDYRDGRSMFQSRSNQSDYFLFESINQ